MNPEWVNPTGEWRVGCKRLFDFMTSTLVSRLRKERRKVFDEHQRTVTARAVQQLADFDRWEASVPWYN